MAVQSVRIAKIAALANAALLLLLVTIFIFVAWRSSVTEDPNLGWWLVPVMSIYFLLGGVIWIVGLVSSIRAWKKGEPGAKRFLLFNQSYSLLLAVLIGGTILSLTPSWRLSRATAVLENPATPELDRREALEDAAVQSMELGKNDQARAYAMELLALLPESKDNWNYGNAVHRANLVLGQVALTEGRVDEAGRFLLEAGKTPGSPQLNSLGPSMKLAEDLLKIGERDVVLQYLENCRGFWGGGDGKIERWEQEIRAGGIPDFGGHLKY